MNNEQNRSPHSRLRRDYDKHFSGYQEELQLDENGRQKRVLVYRGDYYTFNYTGTALRRVRIQCAALTLCSVIIYLLITCTLSISAVSNAFVSVAELVVLFPIIYLLAGLWNLCTCKAPFQESTPLLSVRRMKNSNLGFLILAGVTAAADVVYLIVNRPGEKILIDSLFLLGLAASMGLQIALRRILAFFQLEKVDPPAPKTK